MTARLAVLLAAPLVLAAAGSETQQPAYASKEDLGQAARCSAIKAVEGLKRRGFQLISVEGTATYKRVVDVSANAEASAGGTVLFVPISASGAISRSTVKTLEGGEVIGVDIKSAAPAACDNPRVRTLSEKGKVGPERRGLLFTDKDVVPLTTRRPSVKVMTISESFKRTSKVEAGSKFTLFGFLKSENKASRETSGDNGYAITFCFRPPVTNELGVRLSEAQRNAPCK